MFDIRIELWAYTLVHYCLYLKPGDILAIHATPLATPLIEAVYREALRVGAYPVPVIALEHLDEILLLEGNDEQLSTPSPVATLLAEKATARLHISSNSNPKALNNIDPTRSARRRQASHGLSTIMRQREQAGEFRWCGTLYPTSGYAQEANMSLHDFEEFVYDVCFLTDPDPI